MTEVVITWEWLVFVDNVNDRTHSGTAPRLTEIHKTFTGLRYTLHALHAIDGAT